MKLKPLYDRLVVKRLEAEEKTSGGIIIPDTAQEKPQKGQVVAAGPGRRLKNGKLAKLEVKKGDKILFGKFSGSDVNLGSEELIIMREDDILAVID